MSHRNRRSRVAFAVSLVAGLVVITAWAERSGAQAPPAPPVQASDPWNAAQLIRPDSLAAMLKLPEAKRPLLFHVGFKALYEEGAIPGSKYVGPCSKPQGIDSLKAAVARLPKDRSIVIYCGCCPWGDCPNMRPAYRTLHAMGFKNARAMYVVKNLDNDWVAKGYPIAPPTR
jgi:thiosulfate/3-mercaptopyruvate sulfurtransferase